MMKMGNQIVGVVDSRTQRIGNIEQTQEQK